MDHKTIVVPPSWNESRRLLNLTEKEGPVKLIVRQHQSPGDLVMLTAAIRDLHKSYPGQFITDVRTSCDALWEFNPYITPLQDDDEEVLRFKASYDLIHSSNQGAHHFIHGFIQDLNEKLGVLIRPTELKGDLHIGEVEKGWFSQVHEILGKDVPYWLINAGCKSDFTCKLWERERFQQVVDRLPNIIFVQIGSKEHTHEALKGDNVINLIGKSDLRQLIRLVYHAAGVISPVSLLMHLSAAIEVHPRYKRQTRPTVVIAGGREPMVWEAYTNHAYLHTCGMLPCCEKGGCWASRVYRNQIGDGDEKDRTNLCKDAIKSESGQIVPRCMDMISVDQVINAINNYLLAYNHYKEIG